MFWISWYVGLVIWAAGFVSVYADEVLKKPLRWSLGAGLEVLAIGFFPITICWYVGAGGLRFLKLLGKIKISRGF